VALPKQIQKQIKQNEEIAEALRKEQSNAREVAENAAQSEIDSLLAEVSPEESKPEKPKAEVTKLRPSNEGGDLESTSEAKQQERTDWKQKYSVLKGKYDAEVPRLHQDLRDANARITRLEDKIASVATKPKEEEKERPRTDFTQEEVEDYGEDLLEVIGRKARQIVEQEYRPKISELESTVSTLKTQLGETGQKVGRFEQNEVFAQLDREVENWRQINVDPEFHEWLDQQDPFSGETRKDLLLRAFNRKNAHQVKAFFEGYKKENAAVVPKSSADSQPSGQGGMDTGSRLNLDNYIAPGTPKGGGNAGAPREKRLWSSAEIGKFYSDVQKGRYKNRPEDKSRIEADIVAATREGRIQS
jgi:predicted  nucleic acid-binding Zn-ribbon protein